jgi:hypothetical protein
MAPEAVRCRLSGSSLGSNAKNDEIAKNGFAHFSMFAEAALVPSLYDPGGISLL